MIYANELPPADQLIALYSDAGMTACTADPQRLLRAVSNSLAIVTAWEGDQLAGLARAVGDGETILFIQDVLVHSAFRQAGIGTQLMAMLLSAWPQVDQCILMSDESAATETFYSSLGFHRAEGPASTAFVRYR